MIRSGASLLPVLVFTVGCSQTPTASQSGEEDRVRQAFSAFQEALKARDPEKIWALLDDDSRAEADRAAQTVRDRFARADAAARADLEKALGLTAAELTALEGKGFLKSKRFHGKYDEIPESKVEKVAVQGDKATVNYTEPDGDKEKLTLVKASGRWKVSVPMPRGD